MQISLKAGDRIFLNGAVVRVDRKVNLELLNDVAFLLESHVLQPGDAVTPLRQLYFVVQTLLIDPAASGSVRPLIDTMLLTLAETFQTRSVLDGLGTVARQVEAGRCFDALKTIRGLYPDEAAILAGARKDAA